MNDLMILSLEDIHKELAKLRIEDSKINQDISILLNQRDLMDHKISTIQPHITSLQLLENETQRMIGISSKAAVVSNKISKDIRDVEDAKARVIIELERIEMILDLKKTVEMVQNSLNLRQFKEASEQTHIILHTPQPSIIRSDKYYSQLQLLETELKQSIKTECERAYSHIHDQLQTNDGSSNYNTLMNGRDNISDSISKVLHYSSLYLFVGIAYEGLCIYTSTLIYSLFNNLKNQGISFTLSDFHTNAIVNHFQLTGTLFRTVVNTIKKYQSQINKIFGNGSSLVFIYSLNIECESLVLKLLNDFLRIEDIQVYVNGVTHSLLIDSSSQKISSERNINNGLSHTNSHSKLQSHSTEINMIVEKLEKISGYCGICQQYMTAVNILKEREILSLHHRIENGTNNNIQGDWLDLLQKQLLLEFDINMKINDNEKRFSHNNSFDKKLYQSSTFTTSLQSLIGKLVFFEEYVMNTSVDTAILLDSYNINDNNIGSTHSHVSSVVDDLFFILTCSINRSVKSHSIECVCAVVNYCLTVIVRKYLPYLERSYQGIIIQGSPTTFSQKILHKVTLSTSNSTSKIFNAAVLLNNLCISKYNILTLRSQLQKKINHFFTSNPTTPIRGIDKERSTTSIGITPSINRHHIFEPCLQEFLSISEKFQHTLDSFISTQIENYSHTLRSALEKFSNTNFILSEGEFTRITTDNNNNFKWSDSQIFSSDYQNKRIETSTSNRKNITTVTSNSFSSYILSSLNIQLQNLKHILTDENIDAIIYGFVTLIVCRLEELLYKKQFTFWGGLAFDRELRTLTNSLNKLYLRKSVREQFSRLLQISAVLQLESVDEVYDYLIELSNHKSRRDSTKLNEHEIKQVLTLRVEFATKSF